jgi:DNA-binding SARP family transcriptional activator/pimeloyl-ACP methyl ester carboxylesterase
MVELRLTLLGTFALSGSTGFATPSKKAQALLAYLAIPAGLPHRREKLASMLWSDRTEEAGRQNLRQCLTAIRKMSDGGEGLPIIAEGDCLRLDPSNVAVDVAEFEQALRSRDPKGLVRAFALYRGELLEGLNLQAEPIEEWLVTERRRLRTIAIEGLVQLLEHQQRSGAREEAMQTALRLLNIDPLQEVVHRSLMRLYHDAGNTAQALWQYGICEKVLRRELNVEPEATTKELRRAILHGRSTSSRSSGEGSARPDQSREPVTRSGPKSPAPKQDIDYCVTSDGIRIAYAVTGSGPPLVRVATWVSHLEHDFASPVTRHLLAELARGHTLVRYDPRGNGMSEWDVKDLSLNVFVRDLEAVVDAVCLDRFTLFGACQDAASAAAYAAKHPERVNGLILCNGTVRGWRKRLDPNEIARRRALSTLILQGWGQENPAYRQVFSSLLIPGGSAEQMDSFNQLERISTSPENAHRLHEAFGEIDISGLLDKIVAPVLILHSRDDAAVPFSQGQAYAAGIPGARFVPLESRNHVLLPDEPAWRVFQAEVRAFLQQVSSPICRRSQATPKSKH